MEEENYGRAAVSLDRHITKHIAQKSATSQNRNLYMLTRQFRNILFSQVGQILFYAALNHKPNPYDTIPDLLNPSMPTDTLPALIKPAEWAIKLRMSAQQVKLNLARMNEKAAAAAGANGASALAVSDATAEGTATTGADGQADTEGAVTEAEGSGGTGDDAPATAAGDASAISSVKAQTPSKASATVADTTDRTASPAPANPPAAASFTPAMARAAVAQGRVFCAQDMMRIRNLPENERVQMYKKVCTACTCIDYQLPRYNILIIFSIPI